MAAVGVGSWLSPLHVAHGLSAKGTKDAVKARRDMTNNLKNFVITAAKTKNNNWEWLAVI